MTFEQKIGKFILRHNLMKEDGKYLVALSGGADSVSLLLILHDMGYEVEACHCNFHLRGKESDRDEQFCAALCQRMGIALHRIHFDTRSYADLHKESIEMAARNLRYRYFEQLRADLHADGICVAHHQDDSVETVLINLIRGTGINGLKGIAPKNGYILRPLLCVERKDILQYLEECQQDYVTDSTNLVDDVVRNKIRLRIIPMLKEINPAVCDNIATTAAHVAEAQKVLNHLYSNNSPTASDTGRNLRCEQRDGVTFLDKASLLRQASTEYALFTKLSPFGFTGSTIEEILDGINTVGKTWQSTTHQLLIDRDSIIIREKLEPKESRPMRIPETGCYVIPSDLASADDTVKEEAKCRLSISERTADFTPSREKNLVTLDADKVAFPLTLRRVATGDRFHPFGMKGSKLVSDYLTDRKKNLFEKEAQQVLLDAQGDIIWIVGERTSEKCKVTPSTVRILTIELTC